MIFHSSNKWRRFGIRVLLFTLILGGVFVVWNFARSAKSPESFCSECHYAGYVSKSLPEKTVAITIDDGPNAGITEKILDTLDEHDVEATFFLIGNQMLEYPELTKKIAESGNTVGNHGYSHEESVHESKERIYHELNRTNKVFEVLTGRSILLYRPPFLLDMEGKVRPVFHQTEELLWIREAGYIPVGADIDPRDWGAESASEVVHRVKLALDRNELKPSGTTGHVILLHATPETAEALPEILEVLTQRGYSVVPLEELLGMGQIEVMPYHPSSDFGVLDMLILLVVYFWPVTITALVFITIFSIVRPVLFIALKQMVKEKKQSKRVDFGGNIFNMRVSLILPAYNEEKNIAETIESVLVGSVIPDEILVIDDGSTDETWERATAIASRYPNIIRVFQYPNRGKGTALNRGIEKATGDVVIAIDGDTVIDAFAVEKLLVRFLDPDVGAVAGKIIPASAKSFLQKIQYLEYIVGQNIDKETLSRFGSVNVVPGALGAWRRDVVLALGGYSMDTLVEDQDLTLAVLGSGLKVVYEPKAVSYTEAPNSIGAFFKQRLRWMFGTFQCVFKHRKNLLNPRKPRVGFVALPYAFLVNVVFPIVLSILTVGVLIGSFFTSAVPLIVSFVSYLFFDTSYAFLALAEEEEARFRNLLLIPVQKLVFMFIYGALTLLVLLKILDGSGTKWHKLLREGAASASFHHRKSHYAVETVL